MTHTHNRHTSLTLALTVIVVSERTATKLVAGQPDPALFVVPDDYIETKPSDALNAPVAMMSVGPRSAKDMEQTRQEGAYADSRYQRRVLVIQP